METQLTLKEIEPYDKEQAKWYLCQNCKRIAKNIKLATCGHIFCGHCLSESYIAMPNKCKTCKIELKDEEIFNGVFLDTFINENINCHCPNNSVGCTWRGKVGEYYEEHIMNCSLREVTNNDDMNENFKLEISVEEENDNWLNKCNFEICDKNKEYEKPMNSYLTPNQLKILQKEINGECYEYTNAIIDDDQLSDASYFNDRKISKLLFNSQNEYSTIQINISKASTDEPYIYMFPFFVTNDEKFKYTLLITKRDYGTESIITLGLSRNKCEYHNYINSKDHDDFFIEGDTITVEYINLENRLIISNKKEKLTFDNIIQEDSQNKKFLYYPFLVSTSPNNAFELHIYN